MRPRVFPAEDTTIRASSLGSTRSFNEAAGIPRGRLKHGLYDHGYVDASMRPRVFPAEDPGVELDVEFEAWLQ